METQIRDDKSAQSRAAIDAIMACVLFTAAFVLGMKAIGLSMSARASEAFSWYIAPILFLAGGLSLAKVTGVWQEIHLVGAGLTWRTAILFGALVIVIPLAWDSLLLLGFRLFAPQILNQINSGVVSIGHIVRSIIGSPIGEEVLMRGWLLAWLAARVKSTHQVLGCTITTANLLTSLSFAGMHLVNGTNWLTPLSLLGIFWVALVLGRARERTGGLLLPMICHAVINAVGHL